MNKTASAVTGASSSVVTAISRVPVRFVAIAGGGMEHVFPPPHSDSLAAGSVSSSQSTTSKVCSFITGTSAGVLGMSTSTCRKSVGREGSTAGDCNGERSTVRAKTAATQAPEIKMSDWADLRSR